MCFFSRRLISTEETENITKVHTAYLTSEKTRRRKKRTRAERTTVREKKRNKHNQMIIGGLQRHGGGLK